MQAFSITLKIHHKVAALLLFSAMLFGCAAPADSNSTSRTVNQSKHSLQAMPLFGPSLSLQSAYAIQTQTLIKQLNGVSPKGFKAGLTSEASQQKFAVNFPVFGVLPSGSRLYQSDMEHCQLQAGELIGERNSNSKRLCISRQHYSRPMLELELGFVLKVPITQAIGSEAELRSMIARIHPVLEVPDLNFNTKGPLLATDIVANNVATRHFAVFEDVVIGADRVNSLKLSVYYKNRLVVEGQGSDALGDQWRVLKQLINHSLDQGWELLPEQILITGALGKMLPAAEGEYTANIDGVDISWQVEP